METKEIILHPAKTAIAALEASYILGVGLMGEACGLYLAVEPDIRPLRLVAAGLLVANTVFTVDALKHVKNTLEDKQIKF